MRIEHIAMYVNDLENTKAFFEKYFTAKSNEGYYNAQTEFRSYFLSFDDGSRLEIMNKPDMHDEKNIWQKPDIYILLLVWGIERQ